MINKKGQDRNSPLILLNCCRYLSNYNVGEGDADGDGTGSAGLGDGSTGLGRGSAGLTVGDAVGVGVAETLNTVAVVDEKLAAKIPDKRNKLIPKTKVVLFNTKSLL